MMYAMKIKKNPEFSPVYESDKIKRENLTNFGEDKDGFTFTSKWYNRKTFRR